MGTATIARRGRTAALGDRALLWLTLAGNITWVVGAHIDAWFHLHRGFEIESFFTAPHAVLYLGCALTGAVTLAALVERRALGLTLPIGYRLVLVGMALFLLGGLFDLAWHGAFGFEVSLQAFLSPAHLWLVISHLTATFGLCLAAAELRARRGAAAYRPRLDDLPLLLNLGILLRAVLWSLSFSEPLAIDYPAGGARASQLVGFAGVAWENLAAQIAGATGVVAHSALLALFLVGPVRRLRLPGGAIAIILGVNGLLVAAVTGLWLGLSAALGAALVGEAIWAWLWRGGLGGVAASPGYWLLAAGVPAVEMLLYVLLLAAGGGLTWTAHLWAGLPVIAGLYGLIVGLLALPPRLLNAVDTA